ncbi:ABC transporter permease [Yinghuangia aomiensis]|uniref:ABC transporter permease n=1 Tax=Yinghuangia aomiensis TaxID=676205 RepID=A0ABP9HVG5_9ACTN
MTTEVTLVDEGRTADVQPPDAGVPSRRRVSLFLERYSLLLLTAAIIVFFCLDPATSSTFPAARNIKNVLGDESVLIVVTLAVLFPLICGEFDFSVGATATASQIAVASASAEHSLGVPLSVVIGVGVGVAVGAVNTILVTRVGISGIIATLGVGTLLAGLVMLYTDGRAIVGGIPTSITDFGANDVLGVPAITICTVGFGMLVLYALTFTPSGRYLYAVGSNRKAARLVGLKVERLIGGSFMLSGTLAGVAGVLLVARNGVGDPQIGGTSLTLEALSAAFLGATAIRPGRFNVVGAVVAVFFIAFSVSGLSLAGAKGWVSDVFNGTALIVAVAVSTYFARRRMQA